MLIGQTPTCYLQILTRISGAFPLTRRSCPVRPTPLHRSCVSVGTRKGYSITNCDPFGRVFTSSLYPTSSDLCFNSKCRADDGARGIVEMLFCTSLIALVGAADQPHSSPRKLQIVNTKVCALTLALSSAHEEAASIFDLRAAFSLFHPRRQA